MIDRVNTMKIKYSLGWICLLLLGIVPALAQNNNKLYIPDVSGMRGNEVSLAVCMDNETEVTALQFTLALPEGVTLDASSVAFAETRKADHVVTVRNTNAENVYTFMAYSPTNQYFKGNSGALMSMQIQIPETLQEGTTHQLALSDVVLSQTDGTNVLTESQDGALNVLGAPDLAVTAISADKQNVAPGEKMVISWAVTNVGSMPTAAGWSERVTLLSADGSSSVLLGNVNYDNTLDASGVLSRQVEVALPELIGLDGEAQIQVKLTPYSEAGELSAAQENNTAVGEKSLTVSKQLYLEIPQTAIEETASSLVRCKLSRSGNWQNAETFSLVKGEDARVEVPATVTIPQGQSGTYFYLTIVDNETLDNDSIVSLAVSGNGYEEVSGSLFIEDNEYPSLTVEASKTELNEGESFQLVITSERAVSAATTVYLVCDHSKRFTYPAQVTIPAGEKQVTVDVTATEDNLPDVTVSAAFTVSAAKHNNGEDLVLLYDNDLPEIELFLTPTSISESAGPSAVIATLKRLSHTDNAITVKLSDDSNGRLYYSTKSIALDAGVKEVEFTMGVIDNALVDGEQEYSVTAAVYISSCSCSASGTEAGVVSRTLTVLDNDGPSLKLESSKSMLLEGAEEAAVLTITRNTDTSEPLTVAITSDYDEGLTYERTVTIPAGETSVTVPVTAKANETSSDDRTVTFSVVATGYTKGTCWVMVTDQTLPDMVIKKVQLAVTEVEAEGTVQVTLLVANEGVVTLPSQTKVSLYWDNTSTVLASYYTQGNIEPGQTVTMSKSVNLPDVTGTYTLRAVANENRSVKELLYVNNTTSSASLQMLPKFTAIVSTDKAIYQKGDSVRINGQAVGSAAKNAEVEIYVINSGVRQTVTATTDANGHFEIVWTPYVGQSGHFVIGACYPNEGLTTEQAAFDIYGLKRTSTGYITCETLAGEDYSGAISITNPGVLPLTDLKVEVLTTPKHATIEFQPVYDMEGGDIQNLKFSFKNEAPSEGDDWEEVKLRVTTAEGATLDMTIYYYCRSQKGQLEASVSSINTTMIKGTSRDYSFTITNVGKGETGKITLVLPETDWMTLATPKEMASLAYGESATIVLRLTPTEEMQLNVPFTGQIGLNCENGNGLPLAFRVEPVSETTGTLVIDVCDEYTYYTDEAPHVAGAKVVVKHPTTGAIVTEGETGTDGLYQVELPEGYYTISVTADKHDSYTNTILVDPGRETSVIVNLSFQAITYSWDVVETEIEDEYKIVTTVKYETNVPMPVVEMIIPDRVPADELASGESLLFNVVLVNKGLVTAQDVELILPENLSSYVLEAYYDTLNLAPQQSITIPVKVTRKIPTSVYVRSGGLDCGDIGALYFWDCGHDRKWHRYGKALDLGGGCGTGSGGTVGGGGGWWNVPGGMGNPIGPGKPNNSNNNGDSNSSSAVDDKKDPGYRMTEHDCEPCQNSFTWKMAKCIVGRVPIIEKVLDFYEELVCVKEVVVDGNPTCVWEKVLIPEWVDKIVGYKDLWDECIKPLYEDCVPGDFDGDGQTDTYSLRAKARSANPFEDYHYPSYIKEYLFKLKMVDNIIQNDINQTLEVFGDSVWLYVENEELHKFKEGLDLWYDGALSDDKLLELKPSLVSLEQYSFFVTRWKNTLDNVESENKINTDLIAEYLDYSQYVKDVALDEGYSSIVEMYLDAEKTVMEKLEEASSSVCASITLQLSQTMTMTRQAFRGTLTVFNGHETTAMEDVKLNLEVGDEDGNLATSHEFQINTESLDKFGGELNLDAGWSLAANETGTATILFIPTKYAAPTEEKKYSFGGTLSYIDPFTGLEVTRDLYPVTLTVKPSPNLDLTYFMQRDIFGDDALTKDVVEPMVPAEFSLLINNTGYGDATNVRMVTEQPEIIDNEKGLLIDFELLSSQLNGGEHTLALGGSVATEFGTIPAHSTTYAQWWLQSTLLGHFTEYNVEATHVTSYGNEDLSLLNEVTIHELIRSLKVPTAEGTELAGFLVNDIVDAEDMPDMLYLSDATIETVSVTTKASVSKQSDTEYLLDVTPVAAGWNYGSILDPTNGKQKLVGVTRMSDGQEISLRNFWQTDRTLRDGRDPLYENRMHFADKMVINAEQYLLTFEPKPEVELAVEAFEGLPKENTVASSVVETVTVRFNKPIDAATFTTEDLTLNCQGQAHDASKIVITQTSNEEFVLDVSELTRTNNGYFVLTVQTAAITDLEGFTGSTGKMATWVQYADGQVRLNISASPTEGGVVTPASGLQAYGDTIAVMAAPAEGYEFLSWSRNGEVLASTPSYNYVLEGDADLVALFTRKHYQVTLTYDEDGGSVTGSGTGIYDHGTVLKLKAEPFDGYKFDGWNINGTLVATTLEWSDTIRQATTIEALFTEIEDVTVGYEFQTGWNWFSVNVDDKNLTRPAVFLAPLGDVAEQLVGLNGELTNDPLLGWTGTLETIYPNQGYKLLVNESVNYSLTGKPLGLDGNTITLQEGWNWMGYLPQVELSVSEALKNMVAATNDAIKGRDAFAMYDGTSWVGSLTTMVPGDGYLVYSQGVKSFNYPMTAAPAVAASSARAAGIELPEYWNYDAYRYADNMGVVAQLSADEAGDDYLIAAFIDGECRGVSVSNEDYHFITVHGDVTGKTVSFQALNKQTGELKDVKETVDYQIGIQGDFQTPVSLSLGATRIESMREGVYVTASDDKIRLYGNLSCITNLTVIDMSGLMQYSTGNLPSNGVVDVSALPAGVYVITVNMHNGILQQKFVKE